jgi:hypothetical protein
MGAFMHMVCHAVQVQLAGDECLGLGGWQQGMKATEERVVALDRIRCDAYTACVPMQVWAVKAAVDPAMPQAACMENLVLDV